MLENRYTVRAATRRCAATEREFAPGEEFVSVLVDDGQNLVRRDYTTDAWPVPIEGTIGWWRRLAPESGKPTPAPREVLLDLLDEWANQPNRAAMRYVLALMMLRRKIVRIAAGGFLEGLQDRPTEQDNVLRIVCPEREQAIEVAPVTPAAEEIVEIQQQLEELLGAA